MVNEGDTYPHLGLSTLNEEECSAQTPGFSYDSGLTAGLSPHLFFSQEL